MGAVRFFYPGFLLRSSRIKPVDGHGLFFQVIEFEIMDINAAEIKYLFSIFFRNLLLTLHPARL